MLTVLLSRALAASLLLAVPLPVCAADQGLRLGEFTVTIPQGCKATARTAGSTATLTCAYPPKDGAIRTYTLKVDTSRNDQMLAATEGLSSESQRVMLQAGLPSYLNSLLAFGAPPAEAQPPKGYKVDRWTVGGFPESGPGGMTGWCTPFAYHAISARDVMWAQGLACAVVLSNGRDLAVLASTLSDTRPPRSPRPADFPNAPQKIAGSVRHRP